ncbi:hypothetical protein SAMN06265222_1011020 [Neorhodopirellula lusitana]|uniref:Uncharacterized protein n=1 Tax=Neorhodopirellula lusitana TaxID=445327 RepID=A0ABY1PTY9_9BACT|nr:hypothetical protein [Neorhodopirellula lusitana]SMP43881.1 hypothetical protein SAMN06265222_1011020 [Neorhodopirellula lusitana]
MLPTTDSEAPPPAFGIVVYLSKTAEGQVRGRVANLPDLVHEGASEPGVLGKIVPMCKAVLQKAVQAGEQPPWIDPPLEKQPDEQRRFLPMHL